MYHVGVKILTEKTDNRFITDWNWFTENEILVFLASTNFFGFKTETELLVDFDFLLSNLWSWFRFFIIQFIKIRFSQLIEIEFLNTYKYFLYYSNIIIRLGFF